MTCWKLLFDSLNSLIDKNANNNLLENYNFVYIDNNANLNIKTKLNFDKNKTINNLLKNILWSILKTYFSRSKTKLYIKDWQ